MALSSTRAPPRDASPLVAGIVQGKVAAGHSRGRGGFYSLSAWGRFTVGLRVPAPSACGPSGRGVSQEPGGVRNPRPENKEARS